jgi:hypothetical protein
MKIGIVVSYNESYSDMAQVSVYRNIIQYCLLHNYDLYVDTQISERMDRHPAWNKIIACIEALPNYDWIFFIDTDCLIMNHSIKLESLIDDNFSFIVPTHNISALDTPVINSLGNDCVISSQFLVKNNEIGLKILEDIWEAKEWPKGLDINTFDYEGRQVRLTIDKPEFKPHVKIIEEKLLNRFWYVNNPFIVNRNKTVNENVWEPGDFIVHVTNYKPNERVILLDRLNFFSGGLISCIVREKNKIIVSPLVELENVRIHILNTSRNILINFLFERMDYKLKYILYTNDDIDNQDVIINSYSNDILISSKYIECKN